MPHITINVWPGKTEQQKMALAARIAEAVREEFGNDIGYISLPKRKMDWFCVFCYGDEENARIYAVHLTTANQSEIRRAYLVSVN